MQPRTLEDYFNCDRHPLSATMYHDKHLGFFAVADHIDDGYVLAKVFSAHQARGLDVFEHKPLPEFVLFVYPEHTLVPRQQQRFVHELITHYPTVQRVIIITTSAVIISDAVTCEVVKSRENERNEEQV